MIREGLLALALGAGSIGCVNEEASQVAESVNIAKPQGCYTIEDIRIEIGYGYTAYQILCRDSDNSLVLYHRGDGLDSWKILRVEERRK